MRSESEQGQHPKGNTMKHIYFTTAEMKAIKGLLISLGFTQNERTKDYGYKFVSPEHGKASTVLTEYSDKGGKNKRCIFSILYLDYDHTKHDILLWSTNMGYVKFVTEMMQSLTHILDRED